MKKREMTVYRARGTNMEVNNPLIMLIFPCQPWEFGHGNKKQLQTGINAL